MAEPSLSRSGPLEDSVDVRSKIIRRTYAVLEAHARARDIDKAEVIREVLDSWAEDQVHIATLITRLTRCEGGNGEDQGGRGRAA